MKTLKRFLTTSKDIEKSGAVWNMIASIMFSFQQVIFSMVMTHTLTSENDYNQVMSGIFAYGYAAANLFLCIGKYGVRFFQVSDVDREYNFREYRMARLITTIIMTGLSIGYMYVISWFRGDTEEISSDMLLIIPWVCLLKVPDAFEDVYFGEYQKNDRLDIASKMWGIRYIVTILLMITLIVTTKNLYLTMVVSTIVTFIIMIVFILLTKEYVSEHEPLRLKKVFKQLLVTMPLAIGAFLTLYIGFAPRDFIQGILRDETLQAVYNYLAMPVFVVQMMVTFIFNPRIYHISCLWNDRKISEYMKEIFKQVVFVIIITIICFIGAALLGVPVMSLIFNTDLKPYKLDLLIMIIGSGCLGMATLLGNLLTVMRYQNAIMVGYIITSLLSLFLCGGAVAIYGIRGAVVFYVSILFLLSLIFAIEFAYGVIKAKKKASK
ncbi:MAG: hypothetical protein K6E27_00340 [Eubacterium sp.]|nr:hypothetical protein [Eubacterium sp.]